jgi:tight adherence protein B
MFLVVFSIALVLFLGAFLALTALLWGARTRKEADALELRRRVGANEQRAEVLRVVKRVPPTGPLGAIEAWLDMQLRSAGEAGAPGTLAARIALFAAGGALVTGLTLGGFAKAGGLLFGVVPVLLLKAKARKRREEMTQQLPDELDLVARSLRAGHALSDALRTAAEEGREPLGPELLHLTEQHRLGLPLRDCFDDLVERNPEVFDLRLLGSAVMLQRETGANLIEILEHLSDTIRERLVFTHKLAALTAEVRVSAAILASLPFVVAGVLLVLRPAYLSPLVDSPLGQMMLAGGLVSMAAGMLLMRELARVEV